jgi:hypothetical protein
MPPPTAALVQATECVAFTARERERERERWKKESESLMEVENF